MRAGLILCGVSVTWMCAAFGLRVSDAVFSIRGCRSRIKPALLQVRAIESGLTQYQIDHDPCTATKDDLIGNGYVDRKTFEDPWGTTITFACHYGPDGDVRVQSAGPDRVFGTADDIIGEF